jgi:hypothetical protein
MAVEVDEPGLEDGLRHLLERPTHLPIQLDLVVEGAEDGSDAALFGQGRDIAYVGPNLSTADMWD